MTIKATAQVTAVADPEMRFTPAGKGVCVIRVVSNRRKKDANSQWTDGDPSYFDVEAWDKLGERAAENITKGTRLLIDGRMTCEAYETREGKKGISVKLLADNIALDVRFTDYEKVEGHGRQSQQNQTSAPAPWTDDSPF